LRCEPSDPGSVRILARFVVDPKPSRRIGHVRGRPSTHRGTRRIPRQGTGHARAGATSRPRRWPRAPRPAMVKEPRSPRAPCWGQVTPPWSRGQGHRAAMAGAGARAPRPVPGPLRLPPPRRGRRAHTNDRARVIEAVFLARTAGAAAPIPPPTLGPPHPGPLLRERETERERQRAGVGEISLRAREDERQQETKRASCG
jgi:hypothetical protein